MELSVRLRVDGTTRQASNLYGMVFMKRDMLRVRWIINSVFGYFSPRRFNAFDPAVASAQYSVLQPSPIYTL